MAQLFIPSVSEPHGLAAASYLHVVGAAVWEDQAPADDGWSRYFLGVLDGVGIWAVDVPHGEDPADGAAMDLFRYFGVAGEPRWSLAGRAVQIVEWARTHRFCGRCATPTGAVAHRTGDALPGLRTARFPAGRPGDDHAGDPWCRRAGPGGAARPWAELAVDDVQLPRRVRRAR